MAGFEPATTCPPDKYPPSPNNLIGLKFAYIADDIKQQNALNINNAVQTANGRSIEPVGSDWAARNSGSRSADDAGVLAPLPHIKVRIKQGWTDLIQGYKWDWFCTLTFDPKRHAAPNGLVHPEKAFKCFRYFINCLNRELYGRRWKKHGQGVYWVLAFEPQKSGLLHFHALIAGSADLNESARRFYWMDFWNKEFGFAKIEVPTGQEQVSAYCSKYVSKGGEIEFSDNLGKVPRQSGLELRGVQTN